MRFGDHTIGGMVVCDSAEQARMLFEIFVNKYNLSQKTVEDVCHYHAIKKRRLSMEMYTRQAWKKI